MKNLITLPHFKLTITLFALLLSQTHKAQIYLTEEWVHTTGIPDTVDYSASKIDGSGNIYVTTNTISATEKANILTTKYNSSGVVQWEVEKDNTDENDYGSAIDVDGAGNVYVAAATWVDGTNKYDYLVIKYNSSGTQQWTASYNGPGNFYDIPTDIFVDGSGNVYVTGASYGSGTLSDYCTIKYNSSGTQQWASRYDYSSDQDIAAILKQAPSGRIVVVGASENAPGSYDFAMVKYNQNTGAQITSNRNSASGTGFDQVYGADVDAAGNIYITGRASVVDEGFNMKTVKLDTSLAVVWSKNYDFAGLDDESHGVIVDLDNNVYITGWVTNADGSKSFETIKYNSSGTPQWHKEESAISGLDAYSLKISSSSYGDIIVAGNTDNGSSIDFLSVIYNSDGDKLWQEQYDDPDKGDDKVNFVKSDGDNVFYVGGKSHTVSTSTNRLIKYNWNQYIIPPDDDMSHPKTFTFFENKGQIIDSENDPVDDIKYYNNRHNPSLFLTGDNLSYVWTKIDTSENDTIARINLGFSGSNVSKTIYAAQSIGGEYLNYYLPQCGDGITNIRNSDRLVVPELYDNVDLEYYYDNHGLKYYLIVKPGYSVQNDPISLVFDGAAEVTILGDGKLEIKNAIGTIIQNAADAYQIDVDGSRIELGWDADYVEIDDFEIGFDFGSYDDELPLVFEISLDGGAEPEGGAGNNAVWSTLYGFSGWDQLYDVATNYKTFDPNYEWEPEVVFTAGVTYNSVFPVDFVVAEPIKDDFDYFVQSFVEDDVTTPLGTPIWTSFLGGLDREGDVFPGTTFVGGNVEDGTPSIAVQQIDDTGTNLYKIYVVGTTKSDDIETIPLPGDAYNQSDKPNTTPDTYDGIIFRLNKNGHVDWSTYLGGGDGNTTITGVTLDNSNNVYMCGGTEGGDLFPLLDPDDSGPAYSENTGYAFVVEFDENGIEKWCTRFGGTGADPSWERATDLSVYNASMFGEMEEFEIPSPPTIAVTGRTSCADYPATTGAYQEFYGGGLGDAFVMKFGSDYSIEWSTFYGVDQKDWSRTITHDDLGNYYIGGTSFTSANLDTHIEASDEVAGGYVKESPQGGGDGFLAKFSTDGDLLWSTYYGGEEDDYITDLDYDYNHDLLFATGLTESDGATFPVQDLDGAFYLENTLSDISSSFISAFDTHVALVYSTFIGYEVTAYGTAMYAGPNHYYNVGYASFKKGLNPDTGGDYEEFKPLQESDDVSLEDYYQDKPNSVVVELIGSLEDLDYEGYISTYEYDPFAEFGTSIDVNNPNFFIYPNPTNNYISICSNIGLNSSVLYLVNLFGQKCEFKIVSSSPDLITIDLACLPSGIYFLRINGEPNHMYKITKI